ncbi:ribonuclease III [Flavobacteriaceae bacterium Ap0902]|nr:ribonuclease III [Flavobacteriaceae bacterium Ap0902]
MLKRFLKLFKNNQQNSSSPLPEQLLQILQFKPNNPALFQQVFIPRSAQVKTPQGVSINYERLEFLGDAILGAVISKYLYDKAPEQREGYLTQMRSKIVSRIHLNEIGRELKLLDYVDKEVKNHYSLSQDIEGDMFEALIGAIYKDKGFYFTVDFIQRIVIDKYVDIAKMEKRISSYKSYMFEWAQKKKININFNTVEENNADDATIFVSTISLDGEISSKGRGTSKKKAEETAAKRLYYAYKNKM